jgi:hypothetical protein
MPATATKVVSGRVSVCSIRVSLTFLTAPSAASPRAKIDSQESLTEDDKSSSCFLRRAISFARFPLWVDELRMTCSIAHDLLLGCWRNAVRWEKLPDKGPLKRRAFY